MPANLTRVWPDAIPTLYVQGAWPVDERAIAMVGTTNPTTAARHSAFRLAKEAAERDWTVVSGLALGIDGAAHQGALDAGGKTVAVVADGAGTLFPVEHRALADRMLREGGSIVSISPPGVRGGSSGLLLRNRITASLSGVLVAVQSRAWDGAMATLRHGFRQGKTIAALVPLDGADHIRWRGNDLLLRTRSPWREYERQWVPALPIWPDEDFGAFFERVEEALESGAETRYSPKESRETQIRLLEAVARYELPDNGGS